MDGSTDQMRGVLLSSSHTDETGIMMRGVVVGWVGGMLEVGLVFTILTSFGVFVV